MVEHEFFKSNFVLKAIQKVALKFTANKDFFSNLFLSDIKFEGLDRSGNHRHLKMQLAKLSFKNLPLGRMFEHHLFKSKSFDKTIELVTFKFN